MNTIKSAARLLVLSLMLSSLGLVKSQADVPQPAVLLTVDYSNLSAVKFTATGNFSAINYSNAWSFSEGVALLNFLTSPGQIVDLDHGGPVGTSNLTDSQNNATTNTTFNRLSTWNDAHPEYYPNNNNYTGLDLTLWNNSAAVKMQYSTSSQAFYGEAIFDLSDYSSSTDLFPALNSTGDLVIWNGNGTLGTWQVVGVASAVPEPSTYAAILGAAALLGVAAIRRNTKVQAD